LFFLKHRIRAFHRIPAASALPVSLHHSGSDGPSSLPSPPYTAAGKEGKMGPEKFLKFFKLGLAKTEFLYYNHVRASGKAQK
jgi:hypothetical protein